MGQRRKRGVLAGGLRAFAVDRAPVELKTTCAPWRRAASSTRIVPITFAWASSTGRSTATRHLLARRGGTPPRAAPRRRARRAARGCPPHGARPVGHVLALPGRQRVDDGDFVAAGDERVDHVGADEAGPPVTTVRTAASYGRPAAPPAGLASPVAIVVDVTLYTDAACPWAYSANPALRVLEWRYREQLTWRLVLIGLREDASALIARGYDPARAVLGHHTFRERYGMPFGLVSKERPAVRGVGVGRSSPRLRSPRKRVARAQSTAACELHDPLLLDDDARIRAALRDVPGIDFDAIVERMDDADVTDAYERDKARLGRRRAPPPRRSARPRRPMAFRFTAPTIVFERNGARLVAGGWQPILAYDVLVANLEPGSSGIPHPTVRPLLEHFPDGLTTAEVAGLLAEGRTPSRTWREPSGRFSISSREERRGAFRSGRTRSGSARDERLDGGRCSSPSRASTARANRQAKLRPRLEEDGEAVLATRSLAGPSSASRSASSSFMAATSNRGQRGAPTRPPARSMSSRSSGPRSSEARRSSAIATRLLGRVPRVGPDAGSSVCSTPTWPRWSGLAGPDLPLAARSRRGLGASRRGARSARTRGRGVPPARRRRVSRARGAVPGADRHARRRASSRTDCRGGAWSASRQCLSSWRPAAPRRRARGRAGTRLSPARPSQSGSEPPRCAFATALLGDASPGRGSHASRSRYVLEPLGEMIRIDDVRALRHDLHMRLRGGSTRLPRPRCRADERGRCRRAASRIRGAAAVRRDRPRRERARPAPADHPLRCQLVPLRGSRSAPSGSDHATGAGASEDEIRALSRAAARLDRARLSTRPRLTGARRSSQHAPPTSSPTSSPGRPLQRCSRSPTRTGRRRRDSEQAALEGVDLQRAKRTSACVVPSAARSGTRSRPASRRSRRGTATSGRRLGRSAL